MQLELLRRILRHLAVRGTISERGEDLWAATELSRTLQAPNAATGITFGTRFPRQVQAVGTDYLRAKGYSSPMDPRQTFLQQFLGDSRLFWEYLQQIPDDSKAFNMQLGYAAKCHPPRLDMSDSESLFKDEGLQASNAVAFVDIGGGIGIDAAEVRKRYPRKRMPAHVVLQDTPKVIEEAKVNGGTEGDGKGSLQEVELQAYDFFTSQPVQGTRVYLLSSIIRDWPDDDSEMIVGHIAAAMKKGFSKLMISDYVVPRRGCKAEGSGLDLLMISLFGSGEEVLATWERLLGSQELKIVQIHMVPAAFKALIEVELAD